MPLSDDGERVNMLFGALDLPQSEISKYSVSRPHKEAAYGPQPPRSPYPEMKPKTHRPDRRIVPIADR